MARVGSTGVLELRYVPTIADISAPTVVELTGGVDLTGFLVRDGLDTPLTGSTMDVSSVKSRYNATARGSYGGDPINVTLYRDDTNDLAYDTLTPDTDGFLVVARFGFADPETPTIGDVVEVWPIEVVSRAPVSIADNQAQRFTSELSVPTPPDLAAVVA